MNWLLFKPALQSVHIEHLCPRTNSPRNRKKPFPEKNEKKPSGEKQRRIPLQDGQKQEMSCVQMNSVTELQHI